MAFVIHIAGLNCVVNNKHNLIRSRCEDYIVKDQVQPDLTVTVSDKYIQAYIEWSAQVNGPDGLQVSEAMAEFGCFPMALSPLLSDFDAVCLHAAAVEYKGGAYLFTAPSGYGKTTHAQLWTRIFAPAARIINGDHPIVRWHNGEFFAYGTPFCGKEGYNVNVGVPVRGICYLTHSETNRICPMTKEMAFAQLFYDACWFEDTAAKFMDIVTCLVEHVPVYQLYCNQDEDAAHVAWKELQSGRKTDETNNIEQEKTYGLDTATDQCDRSDI